MSMLVSLTDQRKLVTTNIPVTLQLFMFEQDCYEREDPSYFLVRQGKFNKLAKNEDQRQVYYSQLPSSGLRFTLAIQEFINSTAHHHKSILSHLSQVQMRHKLCETVMSQALNYEHQLYERIMVNYHTVKMRKGADRNFEQWLRKKIT